MHISLRLVPNLTDTFSALCHNLCMAVLLPSKKKKMIFFFLIFRRQNSKVYLN